VYRNCPCIRCLAHNFLNLVRLFALLLGTKSGIKSATLILGGFSSYHDDSPSFMWDSSCCGLVRGRPSSSLGL
ncbi:hypothetical protein AALP_AAs70777U000100, partial [Arabis alpina]